MSTNLPPTVILDSAAKQKLFFDTYGRAPLEFPTNDVEAAVNFFETRDFDRDAAIVVAGSLLKQAKLDSIPIFQILKQLEADQNVNINAFVAEILNNNRSSSSSVGYRAQEVGKINQTRNVAA
jgi:hypothetical protein